MFKEEREKSLGLIVSHLSDWSFQSKFQTSPKAKAETLKEVLCLVRMERNRGQYVFLGRKISLHPRPLYFLISGF